MVGFTSPTSGLPLHEESGFLVSERNERFPVVDGIPRFVSSNNYAQAFGLEWKVHATTQLDSHTGTNISRERLERCLGMALSELEGKFILEAGCGAGRFTELMAGAGAFVHSIDLSCAVEANRDNIGWRENYQIAQADLLAPPFRPGSFDVVVCLGVLQHLPIPEEGIRSLYNMAKRGGLLVLDHYAWSLSLVTKLAPLYRLLVKRMAPEKAKRVTDRMVKSFFPLHYAARNLYPAQMLLSRVSPCLVYFRSYPQLTRTQHYEWCRLDTFDHLTDRYKHLRTVGQIRRILRSLGADAIDVVHGGSVVEARCRKA
jgi:2-polyprenyl-3-methyl-5-hydroxy-6-metoxy-1,4-benzoquinol methylase